MRLANAALAATLATLGLAVQAEEATAVKIRSVEADVHVASLRIEGANLALRGMRTTVHLSGHDEPLAMYRLTDSELHAALPSRLDSGTYVVRVSRGARPADNHEVPLTVGIVGPVVQDN